MSEAAEKQPIKMVNDRILVQIPSAEGERKSRGGILIPATNRRSRCAEDPAPPTWPGV